MGECQDCGGDLVYFTEVDWAVCQECGLRQRVGAVKELLEQAASPEDDCT